MDRLAQAKRQARVLVAGISLTGKSDASTDAVIDAIRLTDDCSGPPPRLREKCRTLVIGKALAAIRAEPRASTEMATAGPDASLIDRNLTVAELETALLGIDTFPRCVPTLRVLEGVPLDETATLL